MNKIGDKNVSCPIMATHKRINQVLSIFDDINSSYQDPDKFTSDLNNLIQAMRNVTFILQSEKNKINNFDEWYIPLQDEMKRDDVMRWLVETRNHVVKRGDLEKDSFLSIRVVNHFNQELFSEKFDPFITTNQAIQSFRNLVKIKVPEILEGDIVIEAERQWIVSSYPRAELIDVLIYCFSLLVEIVNSAHQIFGHSILDCEENNFFKTDEDFMVVLRNRLKNGRVTRVSYADGDLIVSNLKRISESEVFGGRTVEEVEKDLAKRYGDLSMFKKNNEPKSEILPFCFLDSHLEIAKRFILNDGFVAPVCFFYYSIDTPPRMVNFAPARPTDRFNMAETIADIAEETHCRAIIFISEAWIGKIPTDMKDYVPARLQVDKKEAVSILAASPDRIENIFLPFYRKDGKIILEKEKYDNGREWPFLHKLQNVWKK